MHRRHGGDAARVLAPSRSEAGDHLLQGSLRGFAEPRHLINAFTQDAWEHDLFPEQNAHEIEILWSAGGELADGQVSWVQAQAADAVRVGIVHRHGALAPTVRQNDPVDVNAVDVESEGLVERAELTNGALNDGFAVRTVLRSNIHFHRPTQLGMSVGTWAENGLTADDVEFPVVTDRAGGAYGVLQLLASHSCEPGAPRSMP